MKAPNFELPMLDSDKTYQLKKDLGKVIMLTFWASWCPDCAADLPKKEQIYKTINKKDVKMLTINVTGRERSPGEAEKFHKKFLQQPALSDEGTNVYDMYRCQGVPTTVIIDKQGNIAEKFGDKAPFLSIVEALGRQLD
ncbi:TlpA family protein disulfide reductase [Sediminibacillus halophilus]|uniref:Peroxiredoxin n=1 Tax=Sediminibacillus halophilus TaxID=482461 RepID=A0A1G9QZQ2_9BACI|nr:TlpA disulfide reductase family protein [Sediminibacillus halophilus]SDM16067.1 Peroxiredoxin [Sediminibacillus halophilus]